MKLEFPDKFSKNTQISNSTKIHLEEAELFHADGHKDGQTNMTKLLFAFRNFANALKNRSILDRLPIHLFIMTKYKPEAN
jgi:hypothetical protein